MDQIPGNRRASLSKTSIREEAENVAKTAEGRPKSERQPGNRQGGKTGSKPSNMSTMLYGARDSSLTAALLIALVITLLSPSMGSWAQYIRS